MNTPTPTQQPPIGIEQGWCCGGKVLYLPPTSHHEPFHNDTSTPHIQQRVTHHASCAKGQEVQPTYDLVLCENRTLDAERPRMHHIEDPDCPPTPQQSTTYLRYVLWWRSAIRTGCVESRVTFPNDTRRHPTRRRATHTTHHAQRVRKYGRRVFRPTHTTCGLPPRITREKSHTPHHAKQDHAQ